MNALTRSTRVALCRLPQQPSSHYYYGTRNLSVKVSNKSSGILEADAGALATRAHHAMTMSLAVLTPVIFLVPDRMTDGTFNKIFGLILTTNITAHSWIGLNYVATDYVPKISKKLLGPARIINAGIAVVTLLGMSKICLSSPGGIKSVVKRLWNPPAKDE